MREKKDEREEKDMELKFEDMPMMGILSQIAHLSECYAKQAFETCDLKPWQAGILVVLSMEGELSQRELAAKLDLTPSSITTSIQKMEKMGYIVRKPDTADQRILRLILTDKSREYLRYIKEVTEQMEKHIFKGLNMEEKMLFKRLLLQVRENLAAGKEPDFFKAHIKF
ncbi:MarR family winged helix-turn-helix transcriptional regulator [Mediterraneibacter agrestimuris]|uniref:MarR family winged helix-turn-helix transcriptional regulator n=1 Tax=Mediterraneibacter agrestimuris TaxID=2941333 RepID=UPI00203AEE71|nr:MarR family transcriptional regulator [Mediterraneibacter agrestimuris]